jgi:polysaccharide biosynthesis transport protein
MNNTSGPLLRATPDGGQQAAHFGASPQNDDLNLRAIALTIWRRRNLVIAFVVVAVAVAMMITSSWEPRYRAAVKVLYSPSERQVVDLKNVVRQDDSYLALGDQLEILQSTTLMERVLAELEPAHNRAAAEAAPAARPSIFGVIPVPEAIAELLIDLGVLSLPPVLSAEELAEQRYWSRINGLRGSVEFELVLKTRVIEISSISTDPEYAARVVNTVASQYIVDQLEAKLEATTSATVWITQRVEEFRLKLQDAEQAVEVARAAIVEEAGQGLEVLQKQLSAVSASLAELRAVISDKAARMEQIDLALSNGEYGSLSEFRASASLNKLRASESDLLDRRLSLSQTVAKGHPAQVRLSARLAVVRGKLAEEAQRIAAALRSELSSLQEREVERSAKLRDLENRVLDQSRSELKVRQLEREASVSRTLYQNFLERLQETSAQMQLESADARVLSPAQVPGSPLRSLEQLVVILSGFGALGLSFGVIWLLEQLSNTFRLREELELATGERVLASISSVGTRFKPWQIIRYFREKPYSAFAETLRHLRTSLISGQDGSQVIMLTSSLPDEGKSTTAMLLGLIMSDMDKKVIILDCDLRRPSLAELLDEDYGDVPGLLAVLEGRAELNDAIRIDEASGLRTLVTTADRGSTALSVADILTSARFADLLQSLRNHYDVIVLDTPSVLAISDSRIIARHADAVVYAVRWDSTPPAAVFEGLSELRAVGVSISGLVFTRVDPSRASGYGYYGGYNPSNSKYHEN